MKLNVTFDSTVYSLEAIKVACYRLMDRFTAVIETRGSEIICALEFNAHRSKEEIDSDLDELKKEILDQDLRRRIKVETEPTRTLILAHAFSKTGLIADEQVPTDPKLQQ